MKTALTLENLHELGSGAINLAFEKHRKRCIEDCLDRVEDDTKRQIVIKFSMTPVPGAHGCEEVHMDVEIKSTVPAQRTKLISCVPTTKGQLFFQPDSPDNANQMSLDDGETKNVDA